MEGFSGRKLGNYAGPVRAFRRRAPLRRGSTRFANAADAGRAPPSSMNDQLPLTVRPVWTRTTRVPVARTVLALVVFLGALLSVVVFTLNRNASRATRQHAATQLAG